MHFFLEYEAIQPADSLEGLSVLEKEVKRVDREREVTLILS